MAEKPIYRCLAKGSRRERSAPRASFNWLIARRGWFRIYADRVECGTWRIAYADVERATLYRFKHLFMKAAVIHFETADGHYQFGFNSWASPEDHIDLEFEEKETAFNYSTFSKVLRLSLILIFRFWVWYNFVR
ncbi:MAG: hypothetical protein ACR2QJ_10205 [Geminicoccaceae bacterium]